MKNQIPILKVRILDCFLCIPYRKIIIDSFLFKKKKLYRLYRLATICRSFRERGESFYSSAELKKSKRRNATFFSALESFHYRRL